MSWDRYALGQKNIFYDEKIHLFPATVLPSHVERVRQLTLDFSCAFGGDKDSIPLSDRNLKDSIDVLSPEPALKAVQKTHQEAMNIVNGGFKEGKWGSFFDIHFFAPLSDSQSVSKEDSRRYAQYLPLCKA
jgi:hypothetical protein